MSWIVDEDDFYHNMDLMVEISVRFDDEISKYVIRAFFKDAAAIDLYTFNDRSSAHIFLKNMMNGHT